MKKFLNSKFLFVFLLAQCISFAQIPDILKPGEQFEFKPHYHKSNNQQLEIQKLQSLLAVRPYDVLKYDIYLDWYNLMSVDGVTGDFRKYTGINTITMKIDSNSVSTITLDAVNLVIDSVISNEDFYPLKFSQYPENFKVTFLTPKIKGDTVVLKVYYTYVGKDNGGLWLFPKGQYVGQGPQPKRDSVFVLERLAYTMAEPQDARKWMPCNDSPFDKAYVTSTVKVPKGFNIAANGIKDFEKTFGDSTYFSFSSKYPMATYLIDVNCSKFKNFTANYVSPLNPEIKLPVEYYVWEDDWTSDTTNGGAYNAEYSFRNTPKMMENYSKIFGEYPFEQYGMVSVQPFSFGGMEHQTMTTINRSWLRGWSETGIAHELAHQWLGDMITCATWFDIWINEGGATWSEALWLESIAGKNIYYQYMNQVADRYKNEESIFEIPIYGVPISSIFVNPIYLLEYNKASWVYHMLKEQLGEEVFYSAFKQVLAKYKYKSLETIDFLNTLKENVPNSPFDLSIFFEQWLAKAGHPKYILNSTTYDWGSGKSKVNIELNQVQEGTNVPKVFVAPIEFQFFKDSVLVETITELNFIANQSFEFFLSFYPDSIAINTNKILCTVQENILSVKTTENKNILNHRIQPNPVSKGDNGRFNIQLSDNQQCEISLYNSFGQKVQVIHNGIITSGNYEISIPTFSLSSGTYIVKTVIGSEQYINKLIIIE